MAAYEVHLEQFDGPLDLLLHLIQEAQIDIKDIFVSQITAQYLKYMEQLPILDMDTASEFLTMAATLVYIKSRQLLPRPPKESEEEAEDPEQLLIRQLREYQAFKEASQELRTLREEAAKSFARLPEDVFLPPQKIELSGTTADGLVSALLALLEKESHGMEVRSRAQRVRPDSYTVRTQMHRIRLLLAQKKTLSFAELFRENADRMEMVVTFMALLEMIAHGEVAVRQSQPFAPIDIRAKELNMSGDGQERYMDEEEPEED